MLPGTFWLKVAWSPPGWRRPKTLALAASEPDLSQRLPVKREPTKVPRGWHSRNRRSFMAGRMSKFRQPPCDRSKGPNRPAPVRPTPRLSQPWRDRDPPRFIPVPIPAWGVRRGDAQPVRTSHGAGVRGLRRDPCRVNGAEDHVHLLVLHPPKVALSHLVNSLRGCLVAATAAGLRRPDQPGGDAWQVLVPVVLRRIMWRPATAHCQGLHRRPETTPLGKASSLP